jgi:tetratricopeptide (TPR) repeat protein
MTDDFMARLEVAIGLQHRGDNAGAAGAFVALAADFPDDVRLPEEAGNIYLYAMDQPRDAIPCYERALPLSVAPTELCYKLGFAHASLGDDQAASRWFARAHEHDPTHALTFLEVGKLAMRAGNYEDAIGYFDTALAQHVMSSALQGGPNPHVVALVTINKARIWLVHLDRTSDGMAAVGGLIEASDFERVRKLATELEEAGKSELAARVLDALRSALTPGKPSKTAKGKPAKKPSAKKPPAKKLPAKKPSAKKKPAKNPSAKKASAKKKPAKKPPAKMKPAKKPPAKKARR